MIVLINLLSNARDTLFDSDKTEKFIELEIRAGENSHVLIKVKDNGVGIAADDIQKIFQHGFTTKEKGHGFGLHSAANAANELGGTLSVHSEGKEQGAIFSLELPFTPPDGNPG